MVKKLISLKLMNYASNVFVYPDTTCTNYSMLSVFFIHHHTYSLSDSTFLVFQGAGRGMLASESIGVGDIALEIPESLIISQELLYESEVVCSLLIPFT